MSDKALVSSMFKEYRKFKNKLITQFKKGTKDVNRHLTKNINRWQIYMKRCPTSYVIREMLIKTIKYHLYNIGIIMYGAHWVLELWGNHFVNYIII